jgi:hypothetical protein
MHRSEGTTEDTDDVSATTVPRVVVGIFFGVATAAGQVLLFGALLAVLVAVGAAAAMLAPLGYILAPVMMVAYLVALYFPPVWIHGWSYDRGFKPRASAVTTVVMTGVGMLAGQLIGAIYFERGHLRGGDWPSIIGAFAGSAVLASLAYLVGPSRHDSPSLSVGPASSERH